MTDRKRQDKESLGSSVQGIRLNKYLSEAGVCSRREADRRIGAGEVFVDGKQASTGMRVFPSQEIVCGGRRVTGGERPVLLAVNKPRGIVCTTSDKDRAENIVDFIQFPLRIYPVGRLDKESEGLLLMTNQGALSDQILRARNGHEKEYEVTVSRPINDAFIRRMACGVPILDTVTRPCRVEKTGERSFRITLTQGLNRQIRRMCGALGFEVTALKRVRIMNIRLDGLKTGQCREVTKEEWEELRRLLDMGGSRPVCGRGASAE